MRIRTGLDPKVLADSNEVVRTSGHLLVMQHADVWIYPNVPGQRDLLTGAAPFRLTLQHGIIVWPDSARRRYPSPLIGMEALLSSRLDLRLDSNGRVWIDHP